MLSDELLAIICCPKCHGKVVYDAQQQLLTCQQCGADFFVKDDIPIMTLDTVKNKE